MRNVCRPVPRVLVQSRIADSYAAGWMDLRRFFFVLSGFVISHSYAFRLNKGSDLGAFLIKRVFRLFPLHVFTFFLTMGLTLGGGWLRGRLSGVPMPDVPSSGSMLETLFLLQSLGFSSSPTFNTPSWSISAELWTYLIFGVFTLLGGRSRASVYLMVAISILAGYFVYRLNQPLGLFTTLEFGFPRCISGFFLGCVIWRAWRATALRPSEMIMNALHCLAFCVLVLEFMMIDFNTDWNFCLPPTFAAVIFLCAIDSGSVLKRMLSTSFARSMGKLSYSFYMLHTAILIICSFAISSTMPSLKFSAFKSATAETLFLGDIAACAYVMLIVVASLWTFRFIENPSRKWGAKVASRVFGSQKDKPGS